MDGRTVAVIGAVNIDICGTSDSQPLLHDSNPGTANISFGGVGRNIAENLCRLGCKVEMITALADDLFTAQLVSAGKALGIGFDHSVKVPGATCSTYISINDNKHDMLLAINDMKIYDHITAEHIRNELPFLNSCDMVVCDTNIPGHVLAFLAENCMAPLAVDPVSMAKAAKLKDIVGRFTLIKPNLYESEFLSGIRIRDDASLIASAEYFHRLGVRCVFISMAENGVFYSDGQKNGKTPVCTEYPLVNASGCGDTLMAAVIWSYLEGKDIQEMAEYGVCASCICGRSQDTVSRELSREQVENLRNIFISERNDL